MARPVALVVLVLVSPAAVGCTTVDPGSNYVVPNENFDQDYFYCHVEPEVLFAKNCGPGDPSDNNSCHFSSSVSGMSLSNHPPVDCGGGDHPVDRTQIGTGSPAEGNYEAASLEMNRDYTTAPLYLRPTGHNHPRQIFDTSDSAVGVIQTWASK